MKSQLTNNEYLNHELLDRLSIAREFVSSTLFGHEAVQQIPHVRSEIHKALAALDRAYQWAGERHL